jgi:hypothetical protein
MPIVIDHKDLSSTLVFEILGTLKNYIEGLEHHLEHIIGTFGI